jgi:hypothetical protein
METIILDGMQDTMRALLEIAVIMHRKYHVVATNPPYMSSSGMNDKLSNFVKREYPDSKSDLSTVFMEKTLEMCNPTGLMAMINIPVWMFLSSYEKLRKNIIATNTIINMLHFGRGIFGSDFGTTSFVIAKTHLLNYLGTYRRLFEKQGAVDSEEQKEKWFFEGMGIYASNSDSFTKIPGSPVAYWVSEAMLKCFEIGTPLNEIAQPRQGLATADNNRFLRLWYEVAFDNCGFSMTQEEANISTKKWFPYNKGGDFRKWYGNNDYVVYWVNGGFEIRNFSDGKGYIRSRAQNTQFYFRQSVTWTLISSSSTAFRYKPQGHLFDVAGMSMFPDKNLLPSILGFCNTIIVREILNIIAPTLNFQVGDIARLPLILSEQHSDIDKLVADNIAISRADWDSFETSWDFKRHPLIPASSIRDNSQAVIKLDDGVEANYNNIQSGTDGRGTEATENV